MLRLSRASVTCLLGFEQGVYVFFVWCQRASVTCLLGFVWVFISSLVSRASGDVLAGRGAVC